MELDLKAPDHTKLSRRNKDVDVPAPTKVHDGPIHLIVDSTGLKISGAGALRRSRSLIATMSFLSQCVRINSERLTRAYFLARVLLRVPRGGTMFSSPSTRSFGSMMMLMSSSVGPA